MSQQANNLRIDKRQILEKLNQKRSKSMGTVPLRKPATVKTNDDGLTIPNFREKLTQS